MAYKIRSGDSLTKIAQQLGTTVQELLRLNPNITNPNVIKAGVSLNVPNSYDPPDAPGKPDDIDLASPAVVNQIASGGFKNLTSQNNPTGTPQVTKKGGSGASFTQSGTNTQLGTQISTQEQNQQQSQQITPDMVSALQFLGFTQDQINAMNPSDAANWAMVGTYMKKQSDLSTLQGQISAQTFNDAYQKALQDPNIAGKYADMATVTSKDFQNSLGQIAQNAQIVGQTQAIQMTNEQRALKENEAAAGRAYSGFRNLAQQQLNTQEQGIIQSTRSQIQQQLRQAQSPIEQQYGSNYLNTLPPAQTTYVNPMTGQVENIIAPTYGTIATLPGQQSQVQQQQNADVLNRQQQIYQTEMPPVVPPTYSPTKQY